MPWFVFSALSYSKCSHSVRKQLSEELEPTNTNLSPAPLWQRSQVDCETAEVVNRQTSSPASLGDLNCTTAANSRRSMGHSQIYSLDEHSNSVKPPEGSIASSADSSSHVYVFTYII